MVREHEMLAYALRVEGELEQLRKDNAMLEKKVDLLRARVKRMLAEKKEGK